MNFAKMGKRNDGSMNPKKIIVFGAGKIGRSFIGQVFNHSGCEVVFADIAKVLIARREDHGDVPLDIIIAENMRDADTFLRDENGNCLPSDLLFFEEAKKGHRHIIEHICQLPVGRG